MIRVLCILNLTDLEIEWPDRSFVNPPYSDPMPWIQKAIEESQKGKLIVLLLKLDSSTRWFAKLIEAGAHILFFNGRLHYGDKGPANFPSALFVLEGSIR